MSSDDAMDALTGLAAALGAADHPLVTCIGEAVTRELIEAAAIRHMAKAIRKQKHGPEYYQHKWEKKVQYAIDLAAWQAEQVQLQSEELPNEQKNPSEIHTEDSSAVDLSNLSEKAPVKSTDEGPTLEEISTQNDAHEGQHRNIDPGAPGNDSVLTDPAPAPPPPPKTAPSPQDRRRSEAFAAQLLNGDVLALSQLEQNVEFDQATSPGAGNESIEEDNPHQTVGLDREHIDRTTSQVPPPPPIMDPTDRQRRASDEFVAHMQMIACVINAQRQVRGWCARRKAEKLRASNLKTTESMLDLLQNFTHQQEQYQTQVRSNSLAMSGEDGKAALDLHATVAALQQENLLQRDKASHDAATIAELQAQIVSLQERASELVSTSEKNCEELEALHNRKVERLQRLLEEEIRRADSLVTQVDHLLQEQATQRRQQDNERRQREMQARAELTQDQEKIDQQAQLIERQQRQLDRQQRQLDALRKQTQELEEENEILHGHQKTAQQQIQQLLKQRQNPLLNDAASAVPVHQREGESVNLSTRVAELEATVRVLTQTAQRMPGPPWSASGTHPQPHPHSANTPAHSQPRGRLW